VITIITILSYFVLLYLYIFDLDISENRSQKSKAIFFILI